MKEKAKKLLNNKEKTLPILSFPSVQLLGISVKELISSAEMQVKGMKAIADRCPMGAALNMMDLSVEAEAFGCTVRCPENEVPTVEKGVLEDISRAAGLTVPPVGAGRTSLYIEGVRLACKEITDRPVFCGVIGPYSLAGRLFDMTELMMECYDSPEDVKLLLEKVTEFLIAYIQAFKEAGADGVVMAEPAAGLLSPDLAEEFSAPYVKRIFEAVGSEDFLLCYHNCGNAVGDMAEQIAALRADIYHFGNAIDLKALIPRMPAESIVMGNLDPLLFVDGTPEVIGAELRRIHGECGGYENFMLSSGCDIPPRAKWENLDAYFQTVQAIYG
ncbi:MAG: uroporphyrinogen decarboxylase family protein [Clostridia bacterium]|nr:uroporphyrinogen decarboxylase family protein [Clostridia bacterium]